MINMLRKMNLAKDAINTLDQKIQRISEKKGVEYSKKVVWHTLGDHKYLVSDCYEELLNTFMQIVRIDEAYPGRDGRYFTLENGQRIRFSKLIDQEGIASWFHSSKSKRVRSVGEISEILDVNKPNDAKGMIKKYESKIEAVLEIENLAKQIVDLQLMKSNYADAFKATMKFEQLDCFVEKGIANTNRTAEFLIGTDYRTEHNKVVTSTTNFFNTHAKDGMLYDRIWDYVYKEQEINPLIKQDSLMIELDFANKQIIYCVDEVFRGETDTREGVIPFNSVIIQEHNQ